MWTSATSRRQARQPLRAELAIADHARRLSFSSAAERGVVGALRGDCFCLRTSADPAIAMANGALVSRPDGRRLA